ncbi:MAG: flavodoxin-dependent (E)-4-hydroxy-3-methylbut-2-enyl-diphosphate synthase [Spirochaetaceae bacterium]|nr:flavodoxin-dependent (E)-4-hydroxy-3-methylbut-2-enyl-diphosphate synthase [Spirochaetaceae bacterium]
MKRIREIRIGKICLGGDHPVAVQTMWDKAIDVIDETLIASINKLETFGCQLIRFAAPTLDSVTILGEIAERINMPLVADIHFDYKIALECMNYNIPKIRINPGNIGAPWKVEEVIKKAKDTNTVIRIGANGGSLPKDLKKMKNRAEAIVKAAEDQLEFLEKLNFHNIVVSLKSSDIEENYFTNEAFYSRHDYPLHLGITEAGPLIPSIVKSSIGLSRLLEKGIGNTIRISISDDPLKEVIAANEILSALKLNSTKRVDLISCPKCARSSFDTHTFTQEIQDYLYSVDKDISVAIMGCMVNGPGESSHADIGISGVGNTIAIFKKGEIIRRETACSAKEAFIEEIEKL